MAVRSRLASFRDPVPTRHVLKTRPGDTADKITKIFEPFYTEKERGVGMDWRYV